MSAFWSLPFQYQLTLVFGGGLIIAIALSVVVDLLTERSKNRRLDRRIEAGIGQLRRDKTSRENLLKFISKSRPEWEVANRETSDNAGTNRGRPAFMFPKPELRPDSQAMRGATGPRGSENRARTWLSPNERGNP